jgi:hypothetical protein
MQAKSFKAGSVSEFKNALEGDNIRFTQIAIAGIKRKISIEYKIN